MTNFLTLKKLALASLIICAIIPSGIILAYNPSIDLRIEQSDSDNEYVPFPLSFYRSLIVNESSIKIIRINFFNVHKKTHLSHQTPHIQCGKPYSTNGLIHLDRKTYTFSEITYYSRTKTIIMSAHNAFDSSQKVDVLLEPIVNRPGKYLLILFFFIKSDQDRSTQPIFQKLEWVIVDAEY